MLQAIRKAKGIAKRKGYVLDDETLSAIGFAVFLAAKKWKPNKGAALETYCIGLALRAVHRLRRWRFASLDDFVPVQFYRHLDTAQELLMREEEPLRSIAFDVWISKKRMAELDNGLTVLQMSTMLERLAGKIREALDDMP